jgi:hypothetical protein
MQRQVILDKRMGYKSPSTEVISYPKRNKDTKRTKTEINLGDQMNRQGKCLHSNKTIPIESLTGSETITMSISKW